MVVVVGEGGKRYGCLVSCEVGSYCGAFLFFIFSLSGLSFSIQARLNYCSLVFYVNCNILVS